MPDLVSDRQSPCSIHRSDCWRSGLTTRDVHTLQQICRKSNWKLPEMSFSCYVRLLPQRPGMKNNNFHCIHDKLIKKKKRQQKKKMRAPVKLHTWYQACSMSTAVKCQVCEVLLVLNCCWILVPGKYQRTNCRKRWSRQQYPNTRTCRLP